MTKQVNNLDLQAKLLGAKRIVVKVGTSSLTYSTGKLNLGGIQLLVEQLAALKNQGKEVLLVTSGAVGAGMGKLGLAEKPCIMAEKQALAAIGQGILMKTYEELFGEFGVNVAQVLLTKEDIAHRERYLNARNTFNALLAYGTVPIINENDTITFAEIKVGDNDTLAALVAGVVEADLLVLLSDIDGLYTANPRNNPEAKRLEVVASITPKIEAMAGDPGSSLGTGGMATKIVAAKIACSCGTPMVLTDSTIENVLLKIAAGYPNGTVFLPKAKHLVGKKGWLAYGAKSQGKILVDAGAATALLTNGGSLLPKGVVGVEGSFVPGDIVAVCAKDAPKQEIAKGFVNYSSKEIKKIKGCHSSDIAGILGLDSSEGEEIPKEIIHRDYMSIKG